MRPAETFVLHRAQIRRVVNAHRASNPRVFGSAALGLDTDQSDVDILVDPTPETTLFDIGAMRHELLQSVDRIGQYTAGISFAVCLRNAQRAGPRLFQD